MTASHGTPPGPGDDSRPPPDGASNARTREAEATLRELAEALDARDGAGEGRIAHLERLPARPAATLPLPAEIPEALRASLAADGVTQLYAHQAEARERLLEGRHTVVATGTASGKSLCYQLPLLERVVADPSATALYLAPTKALARDQLRALRALGLPQVRAAVYDGDTPRREREAIRRTANVALTNPDMLHVGMLPGHRHWRDFLHNLAFVVVDECHVARGVFGAHVAAVLRRLRRVCAAYGAAPTFALASATIANPAEHASRLTGVEVGAVERDGSPRPPVSVALWRPPPAEDDEGLRRSTLGEGGDVLAGLVDRGRATLCFVRSRRAAEVVAAAARSRLGSETVLAYRAGLLAEERREVEAGLIDGSLRGVAATEALELGIDVGALDAVAVVGWPGTAASFWQRAGRAGRRERDAIVVFIGDDDPLDQYLLAHPDQLLGRPLEAATIDVANPYVLSPHLCCAAYEAPLEADDAAFADVDVAPLLEAEEAAGRLRRRGQRWHATARRSPAGEVSLRSAAGRPFLIVDADTGTLVGEVDAARALRTVHPGAVYLHQGAAYRVDDLDLERGVAPVRPFDGDLATSARSDTEVTVTAEAEHVDWGRCRLARGRVEVSTQVLGYETRRVSTGESLGITDLELPRTRLDTQASWLAIDDAVLAGAGLDAADVPGAAHAAEHAAIALLPLVAMCDRWDVGGLSTPWHPDTDRATIFFYDGYPGGAGIAERAHREAARHLAATAAAIRSCPCAEGCPSCVQSPKCGNGNEPLDKPGAVALLEAVLAERD